MFNTRGQIPLQLHVHIPKFVMGKVDGSDSNHRGPPDVCSWGTRTMDVGNGILSRRAGTCSGCTGISRRYSCGTCPSPKRRDWITLERSGLGSRSSQGRPKDQSEEHRSRRSRSGWKGLVGWPQSSTQGTPARLPRCGCTSLR